jgi:hypothetical protein
MRFQRIGKSQSSQDCSTFKALFCHHSGPNNAFSTGAETNKYVKSVTCHHVRIKAGIGAKLWRFLGLPDWKKSLTDWA